MPDLRVVGLDLSLSATGTATRAVGDTGEVEILMSTIRHPLLPSKLVGQELLEARCRRVARIRDEVLGLVQSLPTFIALEGYSYGSKGNSIVQIAELGGAVRVALWEAGLPVALISPSELKLYATGKGNASKEEVLVQAVVRSRFEFFTNNTGDAWWLLQMALAHLGLPHIEMPKPNRAVLERIAWPAIPALEAR